MATIKSYTDIEQSKKLAEILPVESADYCWGLDVETSHYNSSPYPCAWKDYSCKEYYIPCWSLAALLGVVSEDVSLNSFKDGVWIAMIQHNGKMIYCEAHNPVDACYKLILKLNELNLL